MAKLHDGGTVGLAAARNLAAALADMRVVIRSGDAETERMFTDAGYRTVACEDAMDGMGHSLACGILSTEAADGWVVALADMPFVTPATVAAVAEKISDSDSIARPAYRQTPGHPVAFGSAYRDELLALTGDQGARTVIERHREKLEIVAVEDPGVVRDIDHPADITQA